MMDGAFAFGCSFNWPGKLSSDQAKFRGRSIIAIAGVPRTLSGKKLEVPVKKLLLGRGPDRVVNRDSMANPDSFDFFLAYAHAWANT